MAAVHDLSALEQAAAIREGTVGPVELTQHYLDRISAHNDTVGAFVTVTEDLALRQAKEAERAMLDGAELPALHGIPIGIKDLNNTAGIRTTMGSALNAEHVPDFDDHVVELLAEAGTTMVGKTNVPEFGFPFYTENLVAPPARTAWDLTRSAGGSSGGAGAAVAAGLLPFAHANDGGGSLRVPASVCGLFGIKPSRGRVSNGPASSDVTAFSCQGGLSRTVADCAALLDAMVRPIPTEAYQAPMLPPGETFLAHANTAPRRLRIGRYRTPFLPDAVVDPVCIAAWEHATSVLTGLGHEVVDIAAPFDEEFWHLTQVLSTAGQGAATLSAEERAAMTPLTVWVRERGSDLPAVEFLAAMKGLRMATRRVVTATAEYDALLTPTLAAPPRPVGWFTDGCTPETTLGRIHAFSPFTPPYNVTGQPAVSVPLYWTADGLPIGIMLAGRPYDEATLLSLSTQLETAQPWRHRRPAIW